jgi:hypothetical protein
MDVYVLELGDTYHGNNVLGVYSTYTRAVSAARRVWERNLGGDPEVFDRDLPEYGRELGVFIHTDDDFLIITPTTLDLEQWHEV